MSVRETLLRGATLLGGQVKLFDIANERNVAFYPSDSHVDCKFVQDLYADDAELRAALARGDEVALRSALALFALVDPTAAGPLVLAVLDAPLEDGLHVARYVALSQFAALATLDDGTIARLLEQPYMNAAALADEVARLHPRPEERERMLRDLVARPLTTATWQLAERIALDCDPAIFHGFLASEHEPWREWARTRLRTLEDPTILEQDARTIDAENPQPAINAILALGPDRAAVDLYPRFFSKPGLSAAGGRKLAASILHRIMTRVLTGNDQRWRKDTRIRELVALHAKGKGPLGTEAQRLVSVLVSNDGESP